MTILPPIDTHEQRAALRLSNRRVLAARGRWPDGVLEECERLDGEHPGWDVMWAAGSKALGATPTFSAQWLGHDRIIGDWRRPRVLATTVAELVERIEAVGKQIADQRAAQAWLVECINRGIR